MFLEEIIPARPRFKEFFIGYPSLFLLIMVDTKVYRKTFIFLLLGASITGISITNTFCHAFTPINISIIRTFFGLLIGIALSVFIWGF